MPFQVLTDGGPAAVLRLARENVEANRRLLEGAATRSVEVLPLEWGAAAAEPSVLGEPFDWVLGSDVTYSMGAHAPLCQTIRAALLAKRSQGCRAVLAHEHRVERDGAHDERLASLQRAATAEGLGVAVLSTEREGARNVSLLELSLL